MSLQDLDPALRLRTRRLNAHEPATQGAEYVLCWLQQALRAEDNPVLDAAASLCRSTGLPLLVYHGLGCSYPHASWRFHQFLLEASLSLEADLERKGVRLQRFVETPRSDRGVAHRLAERAAVVVTDDQPAFVARWQAEAVAARMRTAVWAVDATCHVPMNAFPDRLATTGRFRRAHEALREEYAAAGTAGSLAGTPMFEGELPFEHQVLSDLDADGLRQLAADCGVDLTLPPVPQFPGTRAAAILRLDWTLEKVLPEYNFRRNNTSDPLAGSRLSPYLHFGVLGTNEVVRAVSQADVHPAASAKFLDELLNWREFFHHLARLEERPEAYAAVPSAARQTLEDHLGDPRDTLYSLDQLIHGETDDSTWNAAQKQYLFEGYMHNNLRMYWGKQLIRWHATPQQAFRTARYLNDRFSLDGRDPSTYGNLQYTFGRGKRASSETPIYGWVPRKNDATIRKRPGMRQWIEAQAARKDYRVAVPDAIPGEQP